MLLKIEKGRFDLIPELINGVIEIRIYVNDSFHVNIFVRFFSLYVTLPILIENIVVKILFMTIANSSNRSIHNLFQLFNKSILSRTKPDLIIFLWNFHIDPGIITESLFALFKECVDLIDRNRQLFDHFNDKLCFWSQKQVIHQFDEITNLALMSSQSSWLCIRHIFTALVTY